MWKNQIWHRGDKNVTPCIPLQRTWSATIHPTIQRQEIRKVVLWFCAAPQRAWFGRRYVAAFRRFTLQLSEDLRCSFQKIYAAAFRRFTLQLSEDLRCIIQHPNRSLIFLTFSIAISYVRKIAVSYVRFLRILLLFLTYVFLTYSIAISYVRK